MPTTVKLKNSVTTTNAPASLQQGEVAINITDKKVWVGNAATTPVQLLGTGANGSFTNLEYSGTFTGGTGVITIGTNQFYKDAAGNIGIGTVSPNSKLEVNGSNPVSAVRANALTGSAALSAESSDYNSLPSFRGTQIVQYGSSATGTTFGISNASLGFLNFQNTSGGLIGTNGGTPLIFGTTSLERMRITSAGDIGINTSAPLVKLDVNGITGWNGSATGISASISGVNASTGNGGNLRVLTSTSAASDVGGSIALGGYFTAQTNSVDFAEISGRKQSGQTTGGYMVLATRADSGNITERMRIDSSGNVGIGTNTPSTWSGSNLVSYFAGGNNFAGVTAINSNTGTGIGGIQFGSDATYVKAAIGLVRQQANGAGALVFYNDSNADAANWSTGDEKMRIDVNGNLLFNSGYGSVAIAYGCRSWVNFDGTGTVAIRGSGNVSSITDNGTGYYTVNFTTAMPDVNYSVVGSSTRNINNTAASTDMSCVNVIVDQATGSFVIKTGFPSNINTTEDSPNVRCAVFR